MSHYSHFTHEERYQISAWLKSKLTVFSIERKTSNQRRLTDFFWGYVEIYYSPEQISGRLKQFGWEGVGSVESIHL